MKDTDITLIIPTLNRLSPLEVLLKSITHRPTLIVIDKGRQCDLPASASWKLFEVLEVAPGRGSVHAMVEGIYAAKTSHVIYFNDDVRIVAPDFIDFALKDYERILGDRDGVIVLNDCWESLRVANFALISRKWFLENVGRAPYMRFYIDNEITEKSRHQSVLGFSQRAAIMHRPSVFVGRNDIMQADRKLFDERMAVYWKKD